MRRKLLVVDDEEAILFAFRDYFTSRAVEVDCAQTPGEAYALAEAGEPGVVLLDLRLGDECEDGLEVARRLRNRHPNTTVIVLTAWGTSEAETEARRLGVNAFLYKPQPLEMVARIIDGFFCPGDERRTSDAKNAQCSDRS